MSLGETGFEQLKYYSFGNKIQNRALSRNIAVPRNAANELKRVFENYRKPRREPQVLRAKFPR